MTKLSGNKFFTKIDLSKRFWQIQMEGDSKELTAFGTPDGYYQFKRMPFGQLKSVVTFNRMMPRCCTMSRTWNIMWMMSWFAQLYGRSIWQPYESNSPGSVRQG